MTPRLLSEADGYRLLESAGIPVPKVMPVTTGADAARAADTIGYPVVMKVISQQVVHKSDAGGVITGIRSPAEATAAFETISRDVKARIPVQAGEMMQCNCAFCARIPQEYPRRPFVSCSFFIAAEYFPAHPKI